MGLNDIPLGATQGSKKTKAGSVAFWTGSVIINRFGIKTPYALAIAPLDGVCPTSPDDTEGIKALIKKLWERFKTGEFTWKNCTPQHVVEIIALGKEYGLNLRS